jgi:hypothetical protein
MAKRSKGFQFDPDSEVENILSGDDLSKELRNEVYRAIKFGEPDDSSGHVELVVDPQIESWLDAFDAFEDGNKSPLVALLKSGHPIPDVMVPHLGDLIERWGFVKPKHRMRTPSHQLTDTEISMITAGYEVDALLNAGKTLSVAVEETAAAHGVNAKSLHDFHAHRRGSDRRVKARSYRRKTP